MSSKRLHPLAQVLKLIDALGDSEKQVVRDYLRPERKRPSVAKKGSRRQSEPKSNGGVHDGTTGTHDLA